tara:strand:- start:943 stop:2580 length:1638 start_codon:yes stop_codon:yes gene_type:complete
MIKNIIIPFIIFGFISCNVNKIISDIPQINLNKKDNNSYSANYLTANYSISKGDAYTASQILEKTKRNPKLLEIKFFSNLVSGQFDNAEKISRKLILNGNHKNIYDLPKYILKIKKNDIEGSLGVLKNQKSFFNLDNLNTLIKFWMKETKRKEEIIPNQLFKKDSLYKLLILENFHNSKKLSKIADLIYDEAYLNSHEYLLLAGFYYRVNNIEKFKKIINTKLSDQFDKRYIVDNFPLYDNMFYKIPTLHVILSSKLYEMINEKVSNIGKSNSYKKILLEFSLYLNPKMDISKYSLAEIYNLEKTDKIALKNLNLISKSSYFFLAANLKKLTIIKSSKINLNYEELLFKVVELWPKNKLVLYRLANYYKTKQKYTNSIKVYENILHNHKTTNHDLFLYASNLDKIGKWDEAKVLLLELIEKNPKDTYTLNYLSYKLALQDQELELALNLIKKALALDPKNGYFLDTLGWVEFKRQNYKSAVYFLEKSVSILPKESEVIDHLGDCYLMLNRKKEAVFEWKKALKYETDSKIIKKIREKINKYEHLL